METPDFFDQKAVGWDENPRIALMATTVVEHLANQFPFAPDTRALELGCGTGQVGLRLASRLHSIAMVDTSGGMLAVLQEKMSRSGIGNLRLYKGDLFQRGLKQGEFDLAYTLMALHHIGEIQPLLCRFFDLLRPGGYLCIGDLEPEDGSFHGEDMKVHRGFDPRLLAGTLREVGFAIAGSKRMMELEKPDQRGMVRAYPLFFLAAQKPHK